MNSSCTPHFQLQRPAAAAAVTALRSAYQPPAGYGGGGGGAGGRWVRGRYVDGDGSDPYSRRPAPHWRRQSRGRAEEGAAAGQQRWQQDSGRRGRKRNR